MDEKLIKTIDEQGVMYSLSGDNLPENYVLSLKNCQAIERGYDLDELAKEYANKKRSIPTTEFRIEIFTLGFKEGFQKALSILGDKKFSEEDVKKAILLSMKYNNVGVIQSLQQTELKSFSESLNEQNLPF